MKTITIAVAVAVLIHCIQPNAVAQPPARISGSWRFQDETNRENERQAKRKAEEEKNSPVHQQALATKQAEEMQFKAAMEAQRVEQQRIQAEKAKSESTRRLTDEELKEREAQYLKRIAEGHYEVPAGARVISESLHDWFLRLQDERAKLNTQDAKAVETFNRHAAEYAAAVEKAKRPPVKGAL